jgi:hypothetical protein
MKSTMVKIALIAVMFVAVTAFFLYTRLSKPSENVVNGIYENSCCEHIIMNNGEFKYGNDLSNYRLLNMKFGLTAFVPGFLDSKKLQRQPGETALIFSSQNGRSVFKTIIDGREKVFVKR